METRQCPIVMITEPGRTPLHLVVRRPLDVGRNCDGLLLADGELSRQHLRGDLVFGPTREAELKGLAGAHRLHPIARGPGNG